MQQFHMRLILKCIQYDNVTVSIHPYSWQLLDRNCHQIFIFYFYIKNSNLLAKNIILI